MYAASIFISSLATIALSSIYFLQNASFLLLVSLRILIGAAHGALFPVTYTLWSQWAVPNERGTLSSVGFCGTNIGTCKRKLISFEIILYFLLHSFYCTCWWSVMSSCKFWLDTYIPFIRYSWFYMASIMDVASIGFT
jgi:sugar phosphate permease